MKKIIKIAGWSLIGILVLFTFFFLWKQSQPVPLVYELITPIERDIVKKTVATGSIEARTQVELKPQVNGIISELRIKAGDMVKTGDIIAIIKAIPDMSLLDQAHGNVELAIIELAQQEREFKRVELLYQKDVVSREEYERMQTKMASAKEALASAKSQVEVITKGASSRSGNINTTQIVSTMTGLVLSVPVKVGSSVSATSIFSAGTTVAKVADMNDIIFLGYIDETEVAKLKVNMNINLQPGSMQDVTIPAVLEYISPEGEEKNGAKMFEIKASAQIPTNVEIRSGYSVNASIVLEVAKDVLSVDETAVEFVGNSAFVYKLTSSDTASEQTFERIPVEIGLSNGLYIEIKSGVTKDMKLRGLKQK